MALEVGGVFARLGARLDESGFDRFDRRVDAAEAKAKRGVTTKVDADTGQAERGLKDYERQVDRADDSHTRLARGSGRLKTAMGSLFIGGAGVAAGAIAFGALAKGAMSAVDAWKESEVIGKRTNNVLESTGHAAGVSAKQVGDLATALSNKSGVDDEVIQSGENVLLTFTNVRNEAGKGNDIFKQATGLALDMSRALGTDLQSANIQLGKALNDPIKGVTALQRVGVSFTAQQKDQIKTLVAHGKTVQAQKLVLGELRKEFGGAAVASATWGDKLKVTFGNLQEGVGKLIAPVFDKAAKALNGFVNGMTTGTGAGGKFVDTAKGVAAVVKSVASGVGGAVKDFVGFIRGNKDAQQEAGRLKSVLLALWAGVKQAGAGIAAAFKGVGPELATIGGAFLRVANLINAAITPVYRRVIPALVAVIKGLAQILRGVIQVVAGLLSGDWGKAWEGAKRIVTGFVSGLKGLLKGIVGIVGDLVGAVAGKAADVAKGLVRELVNGVKKAPGALWNALNPINGKLVTLQRDLELKAAEAGVRLVKGLIGKARALPGELASLGKRAVSALGSALAGIPGAIVGAFKGGGQFLGGIGRGIADWLNAHTPFGDTIKIGPLHAHLPALARGGRLDSPTVILAGEEAPTHPEFFISTNPRDRARSVDLVGQAAAELGLNVEAYARSGRRGKTKAKPKRKPLKRILAPGQVSSAVTTTERGLGNYDRDLARLDRQYGQLDRANSLSVEELLVEKDDGTTVVDEAAVNKRATEIETQIAFLTAPIRAKLKDYRQKVQAAIGVYDKIIGRLNRAIKRARGSRRQSERAGYVTKRDAYVGRRGELADKFADLGLDLADNQLDIDELAGEEADVKGTKPPKASAPAADDPTIAPAPTGDDPVAAAPGAAAPADAAPAAPSALDVAEAAAAAVRAYDSGRADLLATMGAGNFRAPSGPLVGASDAELAAGARYFGAGGAGATGPGVLGAAGGVTQHITLTIADPGDAHTFTQAALHEMRAAV